MGSCRAFDEVGTFTPCLEVGLVGGLSGCDISGKTGVEAEKGFAAAVEAIEGRKNCWSWLGTVEECVKIDFKASLDAGFVSFAWFIDLLEQLFVQSTVAYAMVSCT